MDTATITLHPINHGFDNDRGLGMTTYVIAPAHVASMLRSEYRFLIREGCSPRAARWHVHRMLSMIRNYFGWTVEPLPDGSDDIDAFAQEDDANDQEEE